MFVVDYYTINRFLRIQVPKQYKIKVAKVMVQVELLTLLEDIVRIPFWFDLRAEDGDEVAASCNLANRDD